MAADTTVPVHRRARRNAAGASSCSIQEQVATEFRLLGPIEVVIDGLPVPIAAPRQEIILAMLLLRANQVVPLGRMVDALWADSPPRTAKSQVHITVSALRKLLGAEVIVTRPPGYLIRMPSETLDLERFEILATRGAAAAAEQRTAEAVQCLRSALALWRGHALEGIKSEIVRCAATRLDERRTSVLQTCIELELQLGRHRELVSELAELVAEQPLNERFRHQFMLALYRVGRQADALEALRIGRNILQQELGLDPGDELCRLEHAILTRDPQLELRGRPAAGLSGNIGSLPVPRQMPRTIAEFTGREEILSQIAQTLSGAVSSDPQPDVPIVVLTGRGGIGKTALAVRAAHLLSARFPDGQLFVPLRVGMRHAPSSILEHLLRSVGIRADVLPRDLEGRAAMYRSWLADHCVLVVLDGAANTGQVLPFLPGTTGCGVIVTSGQRLASLEGAHHIDVRPLDDESAFRLLATLLGGGRISAEEQAARDLIRLCEGLPLALRIVAAKLVIRPHWRLGQMVRVLRDETRRLDELDLDGASVRATLLVAYDSLEEAGKQLFRRLSLAHTDDFAAWISAPLLNRDIREAEDILNKLVQSHLVETKTTEEGSIRFYLHDLVRIYATERLAKEEPIADRTNTVRRLLSCWIFLTTMAHRRVYGGDFGTLSGSAERWPLPGDLVETLIRSPMDWFREERPSLVMAIYQAGQLGFDEHCWNLAVTSATFFESGIYNDDWQESHLNAIEVTRRAGNRRGEAALLYSLGTMELRINLPMASHYFKESLKIAEEISDYQACALALDGLGFMERLNGNCEAALACYAEAAERFRTAGDPIGEAHALKSSAQIHMDRLNFDVAERLLDSSLALCQKFGTIRPTAQVQHELAELQLRRGRFAAASEVFESVLRWTQETGDVIGQAYALTGLGNARRMLGNLAGAEIALTAALELADKAGDRLARGRALLALAELHFARDRLEYALSRADDAIRVLHEFGSAQVWQARVLELLGLVHERAGRRSVAEHAWQSAKELAGTADPALSGRLVRKLARPEGTELRI